MLKKIDIMIAPIILAIVICGCSGGAENVVDAVYESQIITVEGLPSGEAEISVADLRKLPQYELAASYQRTTGLEESFHMQGPYLSEVIAALGGRLSDYEGIGVVGLDGYYCLISREVAAATPDLMLALTVDGESRLDAGLAPAQLAVQGQFGPYWVKKVERIILYSEVPEKEVTSVWAFNNLTEGIEPYMYEYYGSKDASIELEQIFTRFDHVDSRSFFTMKSADGFLKNEIINMVKSRYYIKIEGEDAPTNISPHIQLGMNVHHIAWFSTNADAVIFLDEMMKYMDTAVISGQRGIPISEVLYETGVTALRGNIMQIVGREGEVVTVPGEDLSKGIMTPGIGGVIRVIWQQESGYDNVEDLMRIRIAAGENLETEAPALPYTEETPDTVLTISDADQTLYFSLIDLKNMSKGYIEGVYSTLNNWPTKSFSVAKGIDLNYLLGFIGISSNAQTVRVESADGYYVTFTLDQLKGVAYRYPGLKDNSASGAIPVKPMIAWEFGSDTDDISNAREEHLRLVVGQNGLNDVNTSAMVKQVAKIIIGKEGPGIWAKPEFSFQDGLLKIEHELLDIVKVYYTTDGGEPTVNSAVYNPSTSYFQPHLIKPLQIESPATVKAFATGLGRHDSEVAVWETE